MAVKTSGTTLTVQQALTLAQQAGFTGRSLETIVAIAYAESGLRTGAIGGPNSNGTFDYGIVQINSVHMGERWTGGFMSVSQALDPATAFQFAYWLSGKGTSFSAWSTYNSGKYTAYLATVEQAAGTSSSAQLETSITPWWDYSRIDNFGQIDPQGNYYKPDTNVQIPGDYPVQAILPGTVTSLQQTSWGQHVITIKLDNALNPLATHDFYEHLSAYVPGLAVGQHVVAGQIIGYNNPSGQVPLGFGLYSGDVYGSGSAWTVLQQDLAPGGAGLLNPVDLINQAKSGNISLTFGGSFIPTGYSGGGSGFDSGKNSWNELGVKVHNTLVQYPGFYGIAAALDEAEQFQGAYISNANPYLGGSLNPANDVYDWTESIVGTVTGNLLPFVIRAALIGLGSFMIMAFIWQSFKPTLEYLPDILALAA